MENSARTEEVEVGDLLQKVSNENNLCKMFSQMSFWFWKLNKQYDVAVQG